MNCVADTSWSVHI